MNPKCIELRVVESLYPNGKVFGVFYLGNWEIGRADWDPLTDGWKPFGKRKFLPQIHAAKAMIDTLISKADRDRAHAVNLLNDLRLHNGGTLPSTR